LFDVANSSGTLAAERFSGEVYMFDLNWNLTDLSVVVNNSSDGKHGKIVGFRNNDGTVFIRIEESLYLQFVTLFWDNHKEYLFAAENIFGDLFLFDTKTLKWNRIGRKLHYNVYYFIKNQQILFTWKLNVEIWSLVN